MGALDCPGLRSIHTQPIPRIGGVAIFLSSVCAIVSLLLLNNTIGQAFRAVWPQIVTLLGAAAAVFLIGLIDDLWGLPACFKFAAESLGAAVLCLAGIRIGDIGWGPGSTIGLGWFGWPLTVLWIVGITNAVNLSDGLDGLAAGVSAMACGVIAIFAIHGSTIHLGAAQHNDIMMAVFSLALLGGLSGFLFFNFNPAQVFMGDCGSLFIGFTIASVSVMCVSKSMALLGLVLPALALGIPIFDTLFSMIRRFLERRSVFSPDRSHLHHRLLEKGWSQRGAVAVIYLMTALAAGLGLLVMTRHDLSVLLVSALVLCLIVLFFYAVGALPLRKTLADLRAKYRYSHQAREDKRAFDDLQLRFRRVQDPTQWWQAVCTAAQRMDFAWVCVKTTYADGRTDRELWRTPVAPVDVPSMVVLNVPLRPLPPHQLVHLELALARNGSLEAATRRATLFARLLDENGTAGPKTDVVVIGP